MNQPLRSPIPPALNKYLLLESLKQLQAGMRLNLDSNTYILRSGDRYVAYRNWMSALPLIEVFDPRQERELIKWLEQFGYSF